MTMDRAMGFFRNAVRRPQFIFAITRGSYTLPLVMPEESVSMGRTGRPRAKQGTLAIILPILVRKMSLLRRVVRI